MDAMQGVNAGFGGAGVPHFGETIPQILTATKIMLIDDGEYLFLFFTALFLYRI